ncbi:MAG TPA: 23S rRNA (adenine(2503)-C(2))-methyltransferase RlmN [Phycisphaerales bacterium]|nr:23S rRNA (adenine(2503)-C(2))-methyltransferase RlmN [Phycisphaerales bacterium]HIN84281.1 23S rRNA (adenine(2503)-C(2))-methyltransferase RlmN [Phycisphaerales bacterium]
MLGIQSKNSSIDTWRAFYRDASFPELAETSVTPCKVIDDFGTKKFLLKMNDGLETESVILPIDGFKKKRHTLCLSSQVGCAMGCDFCQTAQMGLLRNLTTAEIIAQWHAANHALETKIDNIVFMGMGEPLENLDAVLPAIEILADRNGPCIASSRICVSTVGRIDGIKILAAMARTNGYKRLSLAFSINAPNDTVRKKIMPLARAVSMEELREAIMHYPRHDCGGVLAEYVLIPGVNDSDEHALEICQYLKPIGCGLNVIPYNPRDNSPWPAPTEESIDRFVKIAKSTGQFVRRRITLGRDVMAACGQLGNK